MMEIGNEPLLMPIQEHSSLAMDSGQKPVSLAPACTDANQYSAGNPPKVHCCFHHARPSLPVTFFQQRALHICRNKPRRALEVLEQEREQSRSTYRCARWACHSRQDEPASMVCKHGLILCLDKSCLDTWWGSFDELAQPASAQQHQQRHYPQQTKDSKVQVLRLQHSPQNHEHFRHSRRPSSGREDRGRNRPFANSIGWYASVLRKGDLPSTSRLHRRKNSLQISLHSDDDEYNDGDDEPQVKSFEAFQTHALGVGSGPYPIEEACHGRDW